VDASGDRIPAPVKASPSARRVARELGIDLAEIDGSGPKGRILERDVRDAAKAPRGPAPEMGSPLSPLRRTMAEKLHHWVNETAQFTLSAEADVTDLAGALGALRAGGSDAGYFAAVVRATALALHGHPRLTSQLVDGTRLVVADQISIGVAVAVDDGLLVPVLRAADTQSVDSLHGQIQELAARARQGSLGVDEQRGAVFSVSNLGAHRVDAFTPLLSPGESAILGIGRARLRPAVVDGQIDARVLMVLSLTVDHRIIDGVPAAAFLDDLLGLLERPGEVRAGSLTTSWLRP
jgi:pyruvate dehydrogenase E2 component (dihydrolipoamide acetyltransferase)